MLPLHMCTRAFLFLREIHHTYIGASWGATQLKTTVWVCRENTSFWYERAATTSRSFIKKGAYITNKNDERLGKYSFRYKSKCHFGKNLHMFVFWPTAHLCDEPRTKPCVFWIHSTNLHLECCVYDILALLQRPHKAKLIYKCHFGHHKNVHILMYWA